MITSYVKEFELKYKGISLIVFTIFNTVMANYTMELEEDFIWS